MATKPAPLDPIRAIAALGAPIRRGLYEYVAGRSEPVGRDEAASALGIGRPLAAFHLDHLARAGLLEIEYRRLGGRDGPGAGRPAKLYRRSQAHLEVSLPHRRYELAAELFAGALEAAAPAEPPKALLDAARTTGRRLGHERSGLIDALASSGFEPEIVPGPERTSPTPIRLRNCPFETLAHDHRRVTCAMNRALLEGVLDATGERTLAITDETLPGYCCVAFRPIADSA
ncbi:MAG: helix-turn-helix transcriptional regulator [Candidatus Limnocylindrales bacterium]